MNISMLGICYDRTQTFRRGAAKAPDMLRKIFPKLETFLAGVDLSENIFVNDLGNIYPQDPSELLLQAKEKLKNIRNFPLILGGEHTITIAALKALADRQSIKSFVCFDAHPDCENASAHNSVVRAIAKDFGQENVYLYGVRTLSKQESEFLKNSKIKIVSEKQLSKILGPIYLSIDFDVFDPSLLPTVGNPEPSGLSFAEVLAAIKILAKKISAIDFVEFTPTACATNEVYAMLAGKLIYSALAEIIKAGKK